MKKFAMTYSTINGLLNNSQVRDASPIVRAAYEAINAESANVGCSACAKRKKMSDTVSSLTAQLQGASDLELDRIKKALGVDKLVFPSGLTFVER